MRFNQRVLEEAQDATNPLLERVKFLAITASNLDEFVEIRVAGFLQRIEDGYNQAQPPDEGGLTPQERLDRLSERMHSFVEAQYRCWNEQLLPAMQGREDPCAAVERVERGGAGACAGVLRERGRSAADAGDDRSVASVSARAEQGALHGAVAAAQTQRNRRPQTTTALGVVTVPRALPRLVPLAGGEGCIRLHPAA